MEKEDVRILTGIWGDYFHQEIFIVQDQRNGAIQIFQEFFLSEAGLFLTNTINLSLDRIVYFDVQQLNHILPFPDFETTLVNRPLEVLGCMGMALSLIINKRNPYLPEIIAIKCRFYNLSNAISYGDLKSSTVGQFVCLEGHVVKASNCHPLIERAVFTCAKCQQSTWVSFEDGIYMPPEVCTTPKCNNRYLDFDRSSVVTTDYQRIKLTEVDSRSDDTSRMPRSLEVEVRDGLVNLCIPGDLISVVGIVKTSQVDAPKVSRWGGGGGRGGGGASYRESGLHQLYLLVNSMLCVQSSGDRSNTVAGPSVSSRRQPASQSSGASSSSSRMILDRIPRPLSSCGGASNTNSGGTSNMRDATFSPSELSSIRALALSPHCFALLVNGLCGTIYGHELVKAGLLLALFGGTQQRQEGGNAETAGDFHIRADIHVLVVGDPGLGKSQMLRAAANVAPRAVFVCGNTTTTAGLTVSVSREGGGNGRSGGDLAIEAGALVLADKGVCCIDELDKMTCDHHALLEAMEQQSISIAKSGVVTSLKSRTTVLAAANPVGGHYNKKKTVCENLKMNAALLSRFDLIFILLDKPDENRDRLISEHIMKTHFLANNQGGAPSSGPDGYGGAAFTQQQQTQMHTQYADQEVTLAQRLRRQIKDVNRHQQHSQQNTASSSQQSFCASSSSSVPHDLFTRYIEYAKRFVHPRLTKPAAKVLQRLYLTMRSEASLGNSMPVTTRHLESLIRLSQARARLELREEVTEDDANDVVQLLQESLLEVFTAESGEIDTGRKGGGMGLSKQVKALVKVLTAESTKRQSGNMFTRNDIQEVCVKLKLERDVDSLIEVMRTECYLLLKGPRLYQLLTV